MASRPGGLGEQFSYTFDLGDNPTAPAIRSGIPTLSVVVVAVATRGASSWRTRCTQG
jgi:hypothetical protein